MNPTILLYFKTHILKFSNTGNIANNVGHFGLGRTRWFRLTPFDVGLEAHISKFSGCCILANDTQIRDVIGLFTCIPLGCPWSFLYKSHVPIFLHELIWFFVSLAFLSNRLSSSKKCDKSFLVECFPGANCWVLYNVHWPLESARFGKAACISPHLIQSCLPGNVPEDSQILLELFQWYMRCGNLGTVASSEPGTTQLRCVFWTRNPSTIFTLSINNYGNAGVEQNRYMRRMQILCESLQPSLRERRVTDIQTERQ